MSDGRTAVYDDLAIEPDIEFRRALRIQLEAAIESMPLQQFTLPGGDHVDLPLDAERDHDIGKQRGRGRRAIIAVAAAIVATIAVGIVVDRLVVHDDSPTPATVPTPTPSSTTLAPSTTLA